MMLFPRGLCKFGLQTTLGICGFISTYFHVCLPFSKFALLCKIAGLSVVCDMLLTTHFMTLVQIIVWDLPIFFPICFYLVFGTIEALFLSSSIEKVPSGGYRTSW